MNAEYMGERFGARVGGHLSREVAAHCTSSSRCHLRLHLWCWNAVRRSDAQPSCLTPDCDGRVAVVWMGDVGEGKPLYQFNLPRTEQAHNRQLVQAAPTPHAAAQARKPKRGTEPGSRHPPEKLTEGCNKAPSPSLGGTVCESMLSAEDAEGGTAGAADASDGTVCKSMASADDTARCTAETIDVLFFGDAPVITHTTDLIDLSDPVAPVLAPVAVENEKALPLSSPHVVPEEDKQPAKKHVETARVHDLRAPGSERRLHFDRRSPVISNIQKYLHRIEAQQHSSLGAAAQHALPLEACCPEASGATGPELGGLEQYLMGMTASRTTRHLADGTTI
eukprot:NODE_1443_length_1161_cov_80.008993_g1186_i0.p2 GENE.NODE_1443_length_1161_cov_80.008993_g1186_i0~~NODE_1443_length_1161_cov_80.008993_g1186_i0.p2  ORF type:complete len:336 (-),score=58.51 NODE_1443_length_1161_cov_80.008993_g1186_i0:153-1160(-)